MLFHLGFRCHTQQQYSRVSDLSLAVMGSVNAAFYTA